MDKSGPDADLPATAEGGSEGERAQDRSSAGRRTAWAPDHNFLTLLVEMGIPRALAKKALFHTGNTSADLAASWVLEGDFSAAQLSENTDDDDDPDYDVYKMVFVVNGSLQMGVGKVAAQVAHAAIGIHRLLLQDEGKYGEMLLEWQTFGETKIVLRGETTQHLIDLENQALSIGLPTYLVQDAGRTQVPEGSTTVLCIIGRIDLVDQVTGKLKLL